MNSTINNPLSLSVATATASPLGLTPDQASQLSRASSAGAAADASVLNSIIGRTPTAAELSQLATGRAPSPNP